MFPANLHSELDDAITNAAEALEDYIVWLNNNKNSMSDDFSVGRSGYEYFLHEIALIPYSPEQLISMGNQEWNRSVAFAHYEKIRNIGLPESKMFDSDKEQIMHESIDESDIRRIDWRQLEAHPGLPRYRMAAAGVESLNAVVFIGGSDNPYNYDGIGYNDEPSEPAIDGLLLDLDTLSWRELSLPGPATMDHRGLVPYSERWLTVGGMLAGQEVSDRVIAYKLD